MCKRFGSTDVVMGALTCCLLSGLAEIRGSVVSYGDKENL